MSNKTRLQKVFEPYKNLIVVGGNFGDEGKGKVIDAVMRHYDLAVRFSGGANAGHTVYTPGGKKLVGHLIPCGLAQRKTCVLGRGELVDLKLFSEELQQAKKVLPGKLPNIWLDEMSPVWTPWHALLENWLEQALGKGKVGTTGKGIGPLEGLFKLRIAPVVGQVLLPRGKFTAILAGLYECLLPVLKQIKIQNPKLKIPAPKAVARELQSNIFLIKNKVIDTSFFLSGELQRGRRMLFEGAQALGLDIRFGTYPFVTAGHTAAAGAGVGTGLPMASFGATLMVVKTLPTRVGQGPFVSEMWERQAAMKFAKDHPELFETPPAPSFQKRGGTPREKFLEAMLKKINAGRAKTFELAQYFQVLGDERGATTGRGRSLGFLDIPWLRYACRINRPTWLALTRFDMLAQVKKIPVVMQYKRRGKILPPGKLPPPWALGEITPVVQNWPGFEQDISGFTQQRQLPAAARRFVSRLEKLVGVPILMVGTGPGREDIIVRR